jgi:hypothetical protein
MLKQQMCGAWACGGLWKEKCQGKAGPGPAARSSAERLRLTHPPAAVYSLPSTDCFWATDSVDFSALMAGNLVCRKRIEKAATYVAADPYFVKRSVWQRFAKEK